MIINYFLYVHDILIIFDSNHTNIQAILTDFDNIHPNLHFTAETEQSNKTKYRYFHIQNCTQYKDSHLEKTHFYRYYHSQYF